MSPHTQGPWRPGKTGGAVVADYPIPEVGGSEHVEYYGGHLVAESIAPQNVSIIAAAPEMLTALKDTLDYWTSTGFAKCTKGCDCVVDEVRAAIAKAEGRS